ncbi:MAG TPA: serine hydrolase domain-containing protein [Candidatus Sulfotelmatobacter sp.]|nr:serine hydrolase domain-containing protein [Candidatus Sulfotelmatobacter sp.]
MAGFTKAGLADLHEACAAYVGPTRVPGLVALVARRDQVEAVVLGDLAIGGPPVARDSLFRISSTTKPITAAATLALIGEGLLELDGPVDRLLPELADRRVLARPDGPLDQTVPAARVVTLRDLLTFTFGFGVTFDMFGGPRPWPIVEAVDRLRLASFGAPEPQVPPDPDEWIARLGSLPLIAQPGERWLYNTPAQVLGVLLARAAGATLGVVLDGRLFRPLGMRQTTFWTSQVMRLATAYRPTADGLVVQDEPGGAWSAAPRFEDGAAGLISTADDLLAFARMLLRGGAPVLSATAVRDMTTDQLTPAQRARGGLGSDFFREMSWGFGQAVYDSGAYGWDGGFGTSWLVDPRHDLVVVVMTQRLFESATAPAVHQAVRRAAYAAMA